MARKKIKRILVPIDGSSSSFSAADYAIDIAKGLHAGIVLIHAVEIPSSLSDYLSPIGSKPLYIDTETGAPFGKEIKQKVHSWFSKIEKVAKKENVPVKNEILFLNKSASESILSYAKDNEIDLIVMGSRGRGGFKNLLMGSVSRKVVEHADVPVLIVK